MCMKQVVSKSCFFFFLTVFLFFTVGKTFEKEELNSLTLLLPHTAALPPKAQKGTLSEH